MTTQQQYVTTPQEYEAKAEDMTQRIRNIPEPYNKERLMGILGDIRYRQYRDHGDERAKRLAKNCYMAMKNFEYWGRRVPN